MVDPKLKYELVEFDGSKEITVVLQWPITVDRKEFAKNAPPQERMQLYRNHLKTVKAPVMEHLISFPDIQVRDLPSSGSVIITTSVHRLRELIAKSGALGMHEEVEVLPNAPFQTLSTTA